MPEPMSDERLAAEYGSYKGDWVEPLLAEVDRLAGERRRARALGDLWRVERDIEEDRADRAEAAVARVKAGAPDVNEERRLSSVMGDDYTLGYTSGWDDAIRALEGANDE